MARAIWKGAVSFGMVAIPVRLYIATESKDISFVQLHSACHNRIRQKRWCPYHEAEVDSSEIVKGYEFAKDEYVIMEDADFENLPVPSKHTIEIEQFVDLPSIDPVYFEKSYYLEPENVGVKPYYLLKRALEDTNRVAVAKVSLRQKEHLCCLRPFDNGLIMETMYYADEIRGAGELNLPAEQAESVTPQELNMAVALIDQLTGAFDVAAYRDEYRVALEGVIEAKLGMPQAVTTPPPPPEGKVKDLMDALKASLEAAKAERGSGKEAAAASRSAGTEQQKAAAEKPRRRARKAG